MLAVTHVGRLSVESLSSTVTAFAFVALPQQQQQTITRGALITQRTPSSHISTA
jgi:hypothetical protein